MCDESGGAASAAGGEEEAFLSHDLILHVEVNGKEQALSPQPHLLPPLCVHLIQNTRKCINVLTSSRMPLQMKKIFFLIYLWNRGILSFLNLCPLNVLVIVCPLLQNCRWWPRGRTAEGTTISWPTWWEQATTQHNTKTPRLQCL